MKTQWSVIGLAGVAMALPEGGSVPPHVKEGDLVNGERMGETGTNPEGRGGRRTDPLIPPPAVAAPRTVNVTRTLSLER